MLVIRKQARRALPESGKVSEQASEPKQIISEQVILHLLLFSNLGKGGFVFFFPTKKKYPRMISVVLWPTF